MRKMVNRKSVLHPKGLKKHALFVVGPPGCGKSYLLKHINGSPGEICINVGIKKWWRIPALAPRPRELHFALPFIGVNESLPVYDERWVKILDRPLIEPKRIQLPKKKKFLFATNWKTKFVFDFILPPPDWNLRMRQKRMDGGDERLVDMGLSLPLVAWQIHTHWWLAWHFYRSGLHVMVRPFNVAYPYYFSHIISAVKDKGGIGKNSIFPKGANIEYEMDLRSWIKHTAPKEWRKCVLGNRNSNSVIDDLCNPKPKVK